MNAGKMALAGLAAILLAAGGALAVEIETVPVGNPAATTTWVKFKYFVNKDVPLTVFVFNMTQSDNWQHIIAKPVVGKWTEVTLNVTRDFRKKGGGPAKLNGGDSIDDVFVFAGKPGDKELQLIVDDVQLIGLD